MRFRSLFLAASLVLVACPGDSTDPTPTSAPTDTATPSATPSPEPPPSARAIVYDTQTYLDLHDMAGADLWLYTIESDALTRLTFDGEATLETEATFSPDGTEVYYRVRDFERNRDSIWKLDPAGSPPEPERVVGRRHPIGAFAIHPDAERIAFLRDTEEGSSTVRITTAGGTSRALMTLPAFGGRGGADEDEVRLSFSPDGTMLLVVDTRRNDSGETMFIVSLESEQLIEPRFGTFARWSPDGSTVYHRLWSGDGWFALDVQSDTLTELPIARAAFNPDVSPSGTHLAYDNGRARPRVFVLDLAAGTEEPIHAGVAALWVADDRLVASRAEPCVERFTEEAADRCALAPAWYPTGEAVSFGIDGSGTDVLDLTFTVGADVLFASPS